MRIDLIEGPCLVGESVSVHPLPGLGPDAPPFGQSRGLAAEAAVVPTPVLDQIYLCKLPARARGDDAECIVTITMNLFIVPCIKFFKYYFKTISN